MDGFKTVLALVLGGLQLILAGVPLWLMLRPKNWGSYPTWVSTLDRFSSLDPWAGTPLTDWNLELYLVANIPGVVQRTRERAERDRQRNRPPGPGKRRLGMRESLALRHGPNDEPRFLPRALAKLWVAGVCPAERLPWLLEATEPTLKESDFQLGGVLMRGGGYLGGVYVILFALLFGVYIFAVPPKSHRSRDVERDIFISEPQHEQTISIRNHSIRFHDAVPCPPAMMRVPAGIRVWNEASYEIGWYKAGSGRRLLAAPIPYGNPDHLTFGGGTVLRIARVGLTPEFLQQLKARTPDLDISYITVDGWSWAQDHGPEGVNEGWMWLSLVFGIPAFALSVPILILRWREHNLRRRLTKRLARVYRRAVPA